jgi:type IV fimbrial biogenesis protein FimT
MLRKDQRGVSLPEVCISLAIVGLLFGFGIPGFRDWQQNARIRAMADTALAGLQKARAEAVQRNAELRFQWVDSLASGCTVAAAGPHWVLSFRDVTGHCDQTPANPPLPPAVPDPGNPYIIQAWSAAEGAGNVRVAAGQGAIVFNGLGRVTPVPGSRITIDITNPAGGACLKDGGPMRCLRIMVSVGGQIRLCDPNLTATLPTDPRACP